MSLANSGCTITVGCLSGSVEAAESSATFHCLKGPVVTGIVDTPTSDAVSTTIGDSEASVKLIPGTSNGMKRLRVVKRSDAIGRWRAASKLGLVERPRPGRNSWVAQADYSLDLLALLSLGCHNDLRCANRRTDFNLPSFSLVRGCTSMRPLPLGTREQLS